MTIVTEQKATLGVAPACQALAVARATYYRWHHPQEKEQGPVPPRRVPRALPPAERQQVLALLTDDRFADLPPAEVYATLLDEGKYVCSIRTMYRVLTEHAEVKERRRQLQHPRYAAPELLATGPNQLWSWDITKLKGPVQWTYFSLYVILDVFSRYVVGWMAAERDSATLAQRLIQQTCDRQGVEPGKLTIHADRGSAMIAKSVALLLADLGVTKTHSRPHVSNDNPYSESQFKTLKYSPEFPDRFGSLQDARSFLLDFFQWDQHDAPSYRLGVDDPLRCPLRASRATVHGAGGGLAEGVRGHPGAVRPGSSHAARAPSGGVDQQTQDHGRCNRGAGH
jgi:putative transposase